MGYGTLTATVPADLDGETREGRGMALRAYKMFE